MVLPRLPAAARHCPRRAPCAAFANELIRRGKPKPLGCRRVPASRPYLPIFRQNRQPAQRAGSARSAFPTQSRTFGNSPAIRISSRQRPAASSSARKTPASSPDDKGGVRSPARDRKKDRSDRAPRTLRRAGSERSPRRCLQAGQRGGIEKKTARRVVLMASHGSSASSRAAASASRHSGRAGQRRPVASIRPPASSVRPQPRGLAGGPVSARAPRRHRASPAMRRWSSAAPDALPAGDRRRRPRTRSRSASRPGSSEPARVSGLSTGLPPIRRWRSNPARRRRRHSASTSPSGQTVSVRSPRKNRPRRPAPSSRCCRNRRRAGTARPRG